MSQELQRSAKAKSTAERLTLTIARYYQTQAYPDASVCSFLHREILRLVEKMEQLREAAAQQNAEICQTLGKALGYPWYKDDQQNFPGATEENGVFVGEHVAETLAMEAAKEIERLKAELAIKKSEVRAGDTAISYLENAVCCLNDQLAAKDAMLAAATEFEFPNNLRLVQCSDGSWHVWMPGQPGAFKKTLAEAHDAAQAAGWLSQEAKGGTT